MLHTYLTGAGSSKMELQPTIFREVIPHSTTNSIYFQIIATKLPFLADIMQRAYQSSLLLFLATSLSQQQRQKLDFIFFIRNNV